MSRLLWQYSPPWRPDGPVEVILDKRVLRVGSDLYPVSAMSSVHVDSWEDIEREQAWYQLRRMTIFALPFAGLGIMLLYAGPADGLVGGLLLGVGVLVFGIGLGRHIYYLRSPALFELVAVIAGKRRALFSCQDHEWVWSLHDELVDEMNNTATATTMKFTINGGQGFQFGNGNTQRNNF